MRLTINDQNLRGTVAFDEHEGGYATMSFLNSTYVNLPLGTTYNIHGKLWKVVSIKKSEFNENVYNVDLVLSRA